MDLFDSSTFLAAFLLIALAEIGDKSQLICIALAAQHRWWPVLLGATSAFIVLNILAVLFGAGVAAAVPDWVMAIVVAVLFAVFGVHALYVSGSDKAVAASDLKGRGVFTATFLLVFAAEFGDKTQVAVASLATSMDAISVWVSATAALAAVSALGVGVGHTLMQRTPTFWLHRLGGVFFLVFAVAAGWRAIA